MLSSTMSVMIFAIEPPSETTSYSELVLGEKQRVRISKGGAMAYYTFTPVEDGTYRFATSPYSNSNLDTHGYLFNSDFELIAENDNSGNFDNFILDYKLSAGETYYIGAKINDDYVLGNFYLTVSEIAAVVDVKVEPITMLEKTDGVRQKHEEGALYDEYYHYYWNNELRYTVTFDDGLVVEGDDIHFFDENGNLFEIECVDDQGYYSQWTSGNTYEGLIYVSGNEYSVPVTIAETPVESIDINPITIAKESKGAWHYEYTEDGEEIAYYLYNWDSNLTFTINLKDGTQIYCDEGYIEYNDEVYYIDYYDNQNAANSWEVGKTYYPSIAILGYEQSIPVSIVDGFVQSIEFEPITITPETCGYGDNYWNGNNYVSYYCYDWVQLLDYTVTLVDGTKIESKEDHFYYNDLCYYLELYDYQTKDNIWTVNNTYYVRVVFEDYETEIPVTIESPIENIEFKPILLTPDEDGYETSDYSTGHYTTYFRYMWEDKLSYTIYFKDGTQIEGTGKWFEYNGEQQGMYCEDNQSGSNPWEANKTYNQKVSIMGYETTVSISIESPIESIVFDEISFIPEEGGTWDYGYSENQDNYMSYYRYSWWNKLTYTVNFKDGGQVQGEGLYFQYDKEYKLSFSDTQSPDNQWTVGNTYYGTITVEGAAYETEVPVEIICPIENIEIQPIVIQGQDGYWSSQWENDVSNKYYRYDWEHLLTYTITFTDGSQYQGNGDYFYYNGNGYYIDTNDNQYESRWQPGYTYSVDIEALGYKTQANITIESTLQSVEFEPITLIAEADGYWSNGYVDGEYIDYFYYNWRNHLKYTVTFQNGTQVEGQGTGFCDEYGDWYYISSSDLQNARIPFTVGNTYYQEVNVLGYTAQVPITIVESPVESVVIEPINLIEGTNGHLRQIGTASGYEEYYHYEWEGKLYYTIILKDGTELECNGYSLDYNGIRYDLMSEDTQDETHWSGSGTYYGKFSVLGYSVQVPVNILETPVEKVEFKPINIVKETSGYWENGLNENNELVDYFRYYWWWKLSYTITLKDGTEINSNDSCFEYNGIEYSVEYNDNQNVYNYWTEGNTYYVTASVLGYETEISVNITNSPISNIEFEPIKMVNGTNGDLVADWDENNEYIEYYRYYWWRNLYYTVSFNDGTQKTFQGTSFFDDEGNEYSIRYSDPQNVYNYWTVGNTYYVSVNVAGNEYEIPISIIDTVIESIEIQPIDILPNTEGYFHWDNDHDKVYYYEWYNNLSYTVTFKDGTQYSGKEQHVYYDDDVHFFEFKDDQTLDYEWTQGNTYYPTISVLGYSVEVPVNILESPVDYVEFKPIEVIKDSMGQINEYYDENGNINQYYHYNWHNEMRYTIYMKDGSQIAAKGPWFYMNDIEYYASNSDNQSEDNHWTSGNTYWCKVWVLGYETEIPVSIVDSPVVSIDFEPLNITKNTCGDWNYGRIENEEGYEEEFKFYRYYWWNELSYTINFSDGTQIKNKGVWFNYNGEEYRIENFDNQWANNQWTSGNTYYETINILGYETEIAITIEDIKADSISLNETKEAKIANGGDRAYYVFTPEVSGMYMFSSNADRDTYGYLYDSDFNEITCDDDSGSNNNFIVSYNLEAGQTYYFGAKYLGEEYTGTFEVTLTKAPIIKDIQVAPIEMVEEMNGNWELGWIENEDGHEENIRYYQYYWWNNISCTVTFENGDQIQSNGRWVDYNGKEYRINCNDNQYNNPWTVGNTYYPTISVLGYSTEASVTIIDTPIESIEVDPINIVKETNGRWESGWNENKEYIEYFCYNWWECLSYTAYFKDGTQYKGSGRWFQYNDEGYYIECNDSQSDDNYWTAGNTYYPTINVLGYETEVAVTIGEIKTENGIEYMVQNGIVIVTGVTSEGDVLTIPETIEGLPVVAITSLRGGNYKEIVIPDSVTSLSETALDECYDLEKLTIGAGVKALSNRMVVNSYDLTEIIVSKDNEYFTSVDGIVYDKDVTTMRVIPYGKTSEHTVPETATNINLYFEHTYKFSIKLLNDATGLITEDGVVYNKEKTIIYSCDPAKTGTYTMPDTVETIKDCAFANSSLEKVIVSQKVTDIVYCAFTNSENLKEVVLPDTLKAISQSAFENCGSLEDVNMPSELTHIGNSAFAYSGIKKANIPSGVVHIGYASFKDSALEELTLQEGIEGIGGFAFANTKLKNVKIPDSLMNINYFAFHGSTLESVDLGNGIREIEEYAFAKTNLKSVNIPDSVGYLGEGAFENSKIKDLKIGAGLTNTGDYTFIGIEIEALNIPSNVTKVAYKSFMDCSKLADIQLPETLESLDGTAFDGTAWYDNQPSGVVYLNPALYGYKGYMPENTNIIIKDGTKIIANYAFDLQENLASITLPTSVKTIGFGAFANTYNLTDVYFAGDEIDRKFINIEDDNYWLQEATWHYNYVCSHKYENECDEVCDICGETRETTHTFIDATCTTPATCSVCGKTSGEALGHILDEGYITEEPSCTSEGEMVYECIVCGETAKIEVLEKLPHEYMEATCEEPETCEVCGATRGKALGHIGGEATCEDKAICTRCDEEYGEFGAHKFSKATCTKAKTCSICGDTEGDELGHSYTNACDTSCNRCGVKRTIKHKYSNNCDTTCNVCKAVRKTTHAYKTTTKAATTSKNGSIVKACTVCGKVASTTTIKYAKTFSLSTTEYTYNGKTKKPSVTVKDSSGKKLKKDVDYKVTYPKSTKNVGTYKVKIELKGKYSGTKTLTFKINPTKTTVSKLTAGKKKLTVSITKKSTQVTGYQIQYSTSKKFSSSKTKTIKSYKTTKATLSSLKAKKTYYVRIRTYKTVDGKKYYSDWSGYKSKKTK